MEELTSLIDLKAKTILKLCFKMVVEICLALSLCFTLPIDHVNYSSRSFEFQKTKAAILQTVIWGVSLMGLCLTYFYVMEA